MQGPRMGVEPCASQREILIVDDEPGIVALLTTTLSEWDSKKGVASIGACSAEDALALLESRHDSIDLIISDLNMPGMRGSDFLLAVRERYPDISTMIVSGAADLEEMQKALKAGVLAYLIKPCDMSELSREADIALEVTRLKRENRLHARRISEELRWAGELQRGFLRVEPDLDERLELSVSYVPLPEFQCGGDYYHVVPVSPTSWFFLMGDVGGHGIRAALITAMLKSIVSGLWGCETPQALLEQLNRRLCRDMRNLPDMLVTFVACLVDTSKGTLTHANAGHLPFFVVRRGSCLRFRAHGVSLGFHPDSVYREETVALESSDRIVICTDGLVECLSDTPSVAEAELSRLLVECEDSGYYNAEVLDRVLKLAPSGRFADDVALLSVRFR